MRRRKFWQYTNPACTQTLRPRETRLVAGVTIGYSICVLATVHGESATKYQVKSWGRHRGGGRGCGPQLVGEPLQPNGTRTVFPTLPHNAAFPSRDAWSEAQAWQNAIAGQTENFVHMHLLRLCKHITNSVNSCRSLFVPVL